MKNIFRGAAIAIIAVLMVFSAYYAEGPGAFEMSFQPVYEEQPVEMVVLMYHSIDSSTKRSGTYVITPEALRNDLEYLKNEGYTTVVMADLIAYVQDGTPLPNKPVMLTFDDGYYNNYLNAYPLLQEYQMKAVISVIGSEIDKFSVVEDLREKYASLTWSMIQEMKESGLVEFQNHSYGLHFRGSRHGLSKKKGETTAQYQKIIGADIQKLQDRFTDLAGCTPTTFTYPYGVVTKDGDALLKEMGFIATLDSRSRVFKVTRDESCLWRIPRYNRPAGTTAKSIMEKAFPNADTGR